MTVYDKAKYHEEGDSDDYPQELKVRPGYAHGGFFLGWIIDRELYSADFAQQYAGGIKAFRRREMTGPQLYERAGGVLASDMLNEAGNVYTASRYDNYLSDYLFYLNLEDEVESPYHVPDTWENYEAIKFNLDEDYQYWQEHISR